MVTNAFVLSGGGAAGDFEIGVLRLLLARGIAPDILVGTSVGAINATKLAEGEGTPDQGFAGLLSVWLSLRGNGDMWGPAPWLAAMPDSVRLPLLDFTLPKIREPQTFDEALDVVELLWNDGPAIVDSIRQLTSARSLATLDPIASRFGALLDLTKLRASGRRLRLGAVALESGRLRFITETGAIVERDQVTPVGTMAGTPPPRAAALQTQIAALEAERRDLQTQLRSAAPADKPALAAGVKRALAALAPLRAELAALLAAVPRAPLTVSLPDGILASSSIAVLFPPVRLGDEHYVDGGHRDQLSTDAAARLGAGAIYAILAAPPTLDAPTPDHPHPQAPSFAQADLLAIGVRAALAIHLNEMVSSDVLRPAGFTGPFVLIAPTVSLHDVLTIDPGLIRIAIGYGFLRAADVLDGASPAIAAGADELTLLRAQMWRKECELLGRRVPTDPGAGVGAPQPARYEELLADAARLRGLVSARRQAGAALPPEAARWGSTWEDHPWDAGSMGPITAIAPGGTLEVFGRALDGRTLTATWAPATGWRGARGVAHGFGVTTGWIEAVASGGEVHAFAIGADGGIHRSVRPLASRTWSPWWPVGVTNQGANRAPHGAAVHAIARVDGELDLFWASTAGTVLTTHYAPITGWSAPRQLSGGKTAPGGHVTVVSRNPSQLDVFTVGTDGGIYTSGLTAGAAWTPWVRIGAETTAPGAYVGVAVRAPDHLDVFVANSRGETMSAARDPSSPDWKGWWWILGGKTYPGTYVTAISAAPDALAIYCVGTDGGVYTATWSPTPGWAGWLRVNGASAAAGRPIWPASRAPGQIDLVYSTLTNTIETCGIAPGPIFGGPWTIASQWLADDLL